MSKNNELEILNEGRKPVAVVFKDGRNGEVTVKKVGLASMQRLSNAQGDALAEAACYLDNPDPATLVETIREESVLDILEAGQEINDPLYLRWLKQKERQLKMRGIDLEELRATVARDVLKAVQDLPASGESSPPSSATGTTPTA